MPFRENVRIRTDLFFRNPRIEELIVYNNRQRIFLIGMIIGIILLAYSLYA